jgi:hypothetical protein
MAIRLNCPRCSEPIPAASAGKLQMLRCPACSAAIEAVLFPVMLSEAAARTKIQIAQGSEAVCYFHSRYRAVTPCTSCGRFLCELCSVNVGARLLCAECISRLRKQTGECGLVHRAALFDNTALFLVIGPAISLFFSIFTLLSAPAALFLSLYYWSRQWTLLSRSRVRFVIAIIFSLLLLLGWAVVIYTVVTSRNNVF